MSSFVAKQVLQPLKVAFLLCFLITITAGISFPFIQPVIPLFYSLAQADKQLVPKIWIFFFPAFAWIVLITNLLLIKFFQQVESNMQKTFAWTTVGIITITGILIIRLITIIT
ncbi:MAG: hypothetical protein IT416_04905 [Candidatus Pacebacteria bacterium]|nr:hypothetical protein [Candidatus Paceibacterota bacterium]